MTTTYAYDSIGIGYRTHRLPDPRFAARILDALADANRILNIGAGTGSYEPSSKRVVAVEPSATMIRQRPVRSAPCVQAVAQALPFGDEAFDAAMAILTVHHWSHIAEGLQELRRVTTSKIVILTWDPEFDEQFWLTRDYLPEVLAFDRARFPKLAVIERYLGFLNVERLPIPWDCTDGFRSAYWKRPHAYLDRQIQQSISSFAQLDPNVVARATSKLAVDLASGEWARRNPELESRDELDVGYRIVTSSS